MPRPGQVLGLVGTNGIGKSTALKILAGKLKPNLGRFSNPPDWEEILGYFRGSELQVGLDIVVRVGGPWVQMGKTRQEGLPAAVLSAKLPRGCAVSQDTLSHCQC